MKLAFILLLGSFTAMANLPEGTYQVDKIQCSTGKELKLGGKFMIYNILLNVTATQLKMTATAKSAKWAPFKLNCLQVNKGDYVNTAEGKYEGELAAETVKCNAKAWTRIMKKRLFGVEEYGEFTYEVNGKKLTVFNPNTITKYSCDETGGYPIYYYTKIK